MTYVSILRGSGSRVPKDISDGYAPLDVHRSVSENPHLRNTGLGGLTRVSPPPNVK